MTSYFDHYDRANRPRKGSLVDTLTVSQLEDSIRMEIDRRRLGIEVQESCCLNERRGMNGACESCGDPCL
jgi:hypothetical protein